MKRQGRHQNPRPKLRRVEVRKTHKKTFWLGHFRRWSRWPTKTYPRRCWSTISCTRHVSRGAVSLQSCSTPSTPPSRSRASVGPSLRPSPQRMSTFSTSSLSIPLHHEYFEFSSTQHRRTTSTTWTTSRWVNPQNWHLSPGVGYAGVGNDVK